jgi:1-aminocyclopropane-1-carboxylate deaminase/D-cysteine desulfhydrase-like pyridoxal-dependent ACC family enzyme
MAWPTQVVAVRVAPRLVANRWRITRLARGAARLLGTESPQLRVQVVNGLGAGYGHPSPAGERARLIAAEHGLRLDPTYGAKAFAVLLQLATGNVQRMVFWHTFAWP